MIEFKDEYKLTVGIEVHAVVTASQCKLFSTAPNNNIDSPNTQIQYLDVGFPGVLQVLNDEPVSHVVRTCIALNMTINERFNFDRKHYAYPDLPLGYQITQFYHPIGINGSLAIFTNKYKKKININRLHMETDAGKSIHTSTKTILDYNRSGGPLMEIVTEPDLKSIDEVIFFIKMLRATLRHINVCDGNMELGNFRFDANISVSKTNILGTRVEIKNLNSIRSLRRSLEYEFARQKSALLSGEEIIQETRSFNDKEGVTVSMRIKEDPRDYMYSPDQDLPSYILDEDMVYNENNNITTLPEQLFEAWQSRFQLTSDSLLSIIEQPYIVRYLDQAFHGANQAQQNQIMKLMVGEIFAKLKDSEFIEISPANLQQFAKIIIEKNLNSLIIKEIINEMWEYDESPIDMMKKKNIVSLSKIDIIKAVKNTIAENPKEIERYKAGEIKLFGFFVGKIMAALANKANPKDIKDAFEEEIAKH